MKLHTWQRFLPRMELFSKLIKFIYLKKIRLNSERMNVFLLKSVKVCPVVQLLLNTAMKVLASASRHEKGKSYLD